MVVYTLEQRWEILRHYFENHGNVAECVRKLRTDFGRREAPSAPYVRYLVKKVKETGILIDKPKREKPKTVRTPENIAGVAESVREAPSTSIHRRSQKLNISETSLRRILHKDLGMTPYKVQLVQELKPTDHPKPAMEPIVIVHGGAGDIPDDRVQPKIVGCKLAASIGYKKLYNGGSVLDAVEAAVASMENDEVFNAGYGSVLNLDAEVEMEASMQRGSDLRAGCVTLVKDISHPISLARRVLEDTPHSVLGGEGARRFAIKQGFEIIDPKSLITQYALDALEDFINSGGANGGSEIGHTKNEGGVGTVGAVAIDSDGRIAVATSTGGITGKYVGRIGDTPQIGSGTYADDFAGGVSTTGHGESILKVSLAHSIIRHISDGLSAQEATEKAVDYMTSRLNNTAGAITLSHTGGIGIYFSSERMAWSYVQGTKIHFGIEKDQHDQEDFDVNKN